MNVPRKEKGMVLAGKMRQRIRIEQPVLTPDGLGGATRAWQTVTTVWGEIISGGGNESSRAGQLSSVVTHRITLRWRADITPEMRVVFGTRVFAIRAIIERDGKRRSIELLTEEGAGS